MNFALYISQFTLNLHLPINNWKLLNAKLLKIDNVTDKEALYAKTKLASLKNKSQPGLKLYNCKLIIASGERH
jgi:hypothetical protein